LFLSAQALTRSEIAWPLQRRHSRQLADQRLLFAIQTLALVLDGSEVRIIVEKLRLGVVASTGIRGCPLVRPSLEFYAAQPFKRCS